MIELKSVTRENYQEIINMRVKEEQIPYVQNIHLCLSKSFVYEEYKPLVIYYKQDIIGFLFIYLEVATKTYWIDNFFIRAEKQQRGYGSWALKKIVTVLKEDKMNQCIRVSVSEKNKPVLNLLVKAGFELLNKKDFVLAEYHY